MPTKMKILRPAPARTPIMQRLKQVMDSRVKIQSGPNADAVETDESGKISKIPPSLCIMEATSYILGWDQEPTHEVNDGPPCTSECIGQFMINLNDSDHIGDRKRAQMKQVIPEIINTAPLVWVEDYARTPSGKIKKDADGNRIVVEVLARDEKNEAYIEAERKREEMVSNFCDSHPNHEKLPMAKLLDFIRELTAVAKFGQANANTEQDMTTPAIPIEEREADNPGGIAGGVLDGTYDPGGPPQSQQENNEDNKEDDK